MAHDKTITKKTKALKEERNGASPVSYATDNENPSN